MSTSLSCSKYFRVNTSNVIFIMPYRFHTLLSRAPFSVDTIASIPERSFLSKANEKYKPQWKKNVIWSKESIIFYTIITNCFWKYCDKNSSASWNSAFSVGGELVAKLEKKAATVLETQRNFSSCIRGRSFCITTNQWRSGIGKLGYCTSTNCFLQMFMIVFYYRKVLFKR